MRLVDNLINLIDALGVPAFAVVGMQLSLAAGLPAPGVVLIGMINGFGGGFLRDIAVGNTPAILKPGRFYLSAGFVACILFVVLEVYLHVDATVAAWIIIGLFFAIRALAVRYDWQTQSVLPPAEDPMTEFLWVVGIAALAAGLTYLGVPAGGAVPSAAALRRAPRCSSPRASSPRWWSITLMPPAIRNGPYVLAVLAFFVGGVLYVALEHYSQAGAGPTSGRRGIDRQRRGLGGPVRRHPGRPVRGRRGHRHRIDPGPVDRAGHGAGPGAQHRAPGVRHDRDGETAGYGGGAPAVAGGMFVVALMAGALLGYLVLQNQPLELRMVLVALASGFLITTVVQGIIPEANREGEPGFAGVLFIGGLSLYALMSLTLK